MDQSLELLTFGEEAREFRNYRATFTLIDLEIEGISREWLAELKDFNGNLFKSAPKEWVKFVEQDLDFVSLPDIDSGKTLLPEVTVVLPSEKQYLRKTRLTQGKFRETLLKRSSSCKVCGMNVMGLLVASHIKPWSACDDEERLNFYNGILLCPSHDALFDKGLISFDSEGNIVISPLLDANNQKLLNVDSTIRIELEPEHKRFMEWHYNEVFIKGQ